MNDAKLVARYANDTLPNVLKYDIYFFRTILINVIVDMLSQTPEGDEELERLYWSENQEKLTQPDLESLRQLSQL